MPDREKVKNGIECCECPTEKGFVCECSDCPYYCGSSIKCRVMLKIDTLALLKEQETIVNQWTKEIADNQLAHAPDELDRENWDYKKGIWDGLQIAWNIISEGR